MPRDYFVYILASKSRELYIGVTNDLARRLAEHRAGIDPDDHAYRNEIHRLVFVERTGDVLEAIRREKQLKGWRRMRKIELIESQNPRWLDLASAPSLRSG
jgi:putative endonuclease